MFYEFLYAFWLPVVHQADPSRLSTRGEFGKLEILGTIRFH